MSLNITRMMISFPSFVALKKSVASAQFKITENSLKQFVKPVEFAVQISANYARILIEKAVQSYMVEQKISSVCPSWTFAVMESLLS